MEITTSTSWVVLVEGASDKAALEALAQRRGRDLDGEGVAVVAIGGAQAISKHLTRLGDGARVAGLCDSGEEEAFRRALGLVGVRAVRTRGELERQGFFVCEPDLEAELIRALGAASVEAVLERTGKLTSFRTFQKQPQWQDRPVEDQLRRFFGSSAGKIKYARLLVEALDLTRVPGPLESLLEHVGVGSLGDR